MKVINATTKRGQALIENAERYEGTSLYDVYGTHSVAKENAYNYCRKQYILECGKNFHIISHNTFGFSVAWEANGGVRIETPTNSYFIK